MDKSANKIAIERTEAVNKLLRANKDSEFKFTEEDISKWEKRASMTPLQRLQELADTNDPYQDDKLQQHFSAIRSIKAVNGGILIDVDEENSKQAAIKAAFNTLGPLAKEEEFKKYVAEHTNKTTLFSIKTFVRNIKLLTLMIAQHPEYFGESKGGSEAREILQESMAAIKEARAYLKRNKDKMPPGLYETMANLAFKTDEKKDFSNYLGEGWEKAALDKDKIRSAEKITALIK